MAKQNDVTVPTSRHLQRIKNRVEVHYRAEKDPERAAVLATVVMDVDKAIKSVLEINLYDEKKAGRAQ